MSISLFTPRKGWRRHLGPHNGEVPMPPYFIEEAFGDNRQNPRFGAFVLRLPGSKEAFVALAHELAEGGEREVVVAHLVNPKRVNLQVCSAMPGDTLGCSVGLAGMDCRVFELSKEDGEWKTREYAEESNRPRLLDAHGIEMDSYSDRIYRVRRHLSMLATAPPEYDPLQNDAAAQVLLELGGAHAIPSAVIEAVDPGRLAKAA